MIGQAAYGLEVLVRLFPTWAAYVGHSRNKGGESMRRFLLALATLIAIAMILPLMYR